MGHRSQVAGHKSGTQTRGGCRIYGGSMLETALVMHRNFGPEVYIHNRASRSKVDGVVALFLGQDHDADAVGQAGGELTPTAQPATVDAKLVPTRR